MKPMSPAATAPVSWSGVQIFGTFRATIKATSKLTKVLVQRTSVVLFSGLKQRVIIVCLNAKWIRGNVMVYQTSKTKSAAS